MEESWHGILGTPSEVFLTLKGQHNMILWGHQQTIHSSVPSNSFFFGGGRGGRGATLQQVGEHLEVGRQVRFNQSTSTMQDRSFCLNSSAILLV